MSLRAWVRAARPLAHANIAPPLALGQAFAVAGGAPFDPRWALFAFAFGAIDHLAIVFVNDYADRDADALHDAPTPFSGGSRVLPDGALRPGQLRVAGAVVCALLALLSLAGALGGRALTPGFAAVAIALLLAYSVRPIAISYRGGGELLQGLGVGLVLPALGFYLQRGSLDGAPWRGFAALVVLGAVSNVLTALPDTRADRRAGKRTYPVRRGERRARRDALTGLIAGVGLLAASAARPWSWRAAIAAPCAVLALVAVRELGRGDAAHRGACLRFVVAAAGAITVAQIGAALALACGSLE